MEKINNRTLWFQLWNVFFVIRAYWRWFQCLPGRKHLNSSECDYNNLIFTLRSPFKVKHLCSGSTKNWTVSDFCQAVMERRLFLASRTREHFSRPYTWSQWSSLRYASCLLSALLNSPCFYNNFSSPSFFCALQLPPANPSEQLIQTIREHFFPAWTTDIYVGGETN